MRPEKVILLVEDNPNDELLTVRTLRRNHVTNAVVVARDGVDGLDYLFGTGVYAGRDVRELPAVALLDVNLPKLDGLEMLEIIREHPYLCSLPVIMFTSSKAESDLIALFDHQANRCVRKPLEGLRLMESFRQLGLDWIGPHLPSLVPSEERV